MVVPNLETKCFLYCRGYDILFPERINAMNSRYHYSDKEKAELLSNPYTCRVTDCKVIFNLEFKQLVINNIDKPGMTSRKIFKLAGYRDELFTLHSMEYAINSIRKEASSPEGLKEPAPLKKTPPKKKSTESELKELQDRVILLEQQIEFLKKSQFLKSQKQSVRSNSSG